MPHGRAHQKEGGRKLQVHLANLTQVLWGILSKLIRSVMSSGRLLTLLDNIAGCRGNSPSDLCKVHYMYLKLSTTLF